MNLDNPSLANMGLQLFNHRSLESKITVDLETLIAYARGELPEEEKAEVTHKIAHDPETYQLWIDLVEANETLENRPMPDFIGNSSNRLNSTHTLTSTTEKTKRKRKFDFTIMGWASVLATSCALAILFVMQPADKTIYDGVHQLYQAYTPNTAPVLPFRGHFETKEIRLNSPVAAAVASGINAGLHQLGDAFSIEGYTSSDLLKLGVTSEQPGDKTLDMYFSAGYLSAITHFRCHMKQPQDDFFQETNALFTTFQKTFQSIDKTMGPLEINSGTQRARTCLFSNAILKTVF